MIRRILLGAIAAFALTAPAQAETIAIVHARAHSIAVPTPIDNATIVMTDGKIMSVIAGGAVPAGARVVDAANRPVTPGLMSAATQLGLIEVASADGTMDQSVATGALGAAFDVQYALNANSVLVPQARADGLVRAMSFPGGAATAPFAGQGALIRLIPGPSILDRPRAAMFVTIGGGSSAKAGGSRAAQWSLLRNALDEAKVYAAAPRPNAPRDQLLNRLDIQALAPVLARTMPLAITTNRESDIRQAIRLASDYRIRVVIVGGAEAWRVAPELAAAGIAVVIDPEANLPTSFDELGARLDNAALLRKAGVTIAFSVAGGGLHLSYNVGLALREGAGIAVANGLPYADALKAITLNPARIWGMDDFGTLTAGADADVVIWDGDPLEPSSAPAMLFVQGKAVSLTTRQTELRDRYAPAHAEDALPAGYR